MDRARAAVRPGGAAGRGSTASDRIDLAKRAGHVGVDHRPVHPVRRGDGQAVQDGPGDVAAGRRGNPGGLVDEPTGWVAFFCTEASATVVEIRRPPAIGSPWRRPSVIARRSSGPGSSRCNSSGRTSVRSTSAYGPSR